MNRDQTEIRTINALQKLHEMTQQNSPESAGTAWYEFLSTFARLNGRYPSPEALYETVRATCRIQDLDLVDLGLR